ncbi:hypothetical protein [Natrialba sp. INN-245]|uniref:hypothetical protein n=1 Tax=Natrialba sp. INN-245 TaxID=2690967 RepID=UPI0013139DEF|nr:hypothetical protein [Natrialba sp. INN-245]MWV38812.1 hypothetical protein [Natrialba sp. INN-245]
MSKIPDPNGQPPGDDLLHVLTDKSRSKIQNKEEENIFNRWLDKVTSDGPDVWETVPGEYPSKTRKDDHAIVFKEVALQTQKRIDGVVRWPRDQARWPEKEIHCYELVEVKSTDGEIPEEVIGELLMESETFKSEFFLSSWEVEVTILLNDVSWESKQDFQKMCDVRDIEIGLEVAPND